LKYNFIYQALEAKLTNEFSQMLFTQSDQHQQQMEQLKVGGGVIYSYNTLNCWPNRQMSK
jgi:hypothetical protein